MAIIFLIAYTDQITRIKIYLQNITKLQVFIDDFRITAADLVTIARGKTPSRVADLAQLMERCKLVWVAVRPVTDYEYSWDGEELCDLDTLQAALSRAGYQPSVLPHVMRNSDKYFDEF